MKRVSKSFLGMGTGLILGTTFLVPTAFASANYVPTNGTYYTNSQQNVGQMAYEGNTYSDLVDGNYIGTQHTGALMSAMVKQTNDWRNQISEWGYSENVGPYLNLPHGNTYVFGVDFEAADRSAISGGTDYNTVNGAQPYPGNSTSYSWAADLIGLGVLAYPESTLYAAVSGVTSLLLNNLQVTPGISTNSGGVGAAEWEIYWNAVNEEYDMTNQYPYTDDVNYEGYTQQFSFAGQSGTPVADLGHIVYATDYYATNPNYMQVAYDDSGTMTNYFNLP